MGRDRLADIAAYTDARGMNTVESYHSYAEAWPEGLYADRAHGRLEDLQPSQEIYRAAALSEDLSEIDHAAGLVKGTGYERLLLSRAAELASGRARESLRQNERYEPLSVFPALPRTTSAFLAARHARRSRCGWSPRREPLVGSWFRELP
jgi:hypothetical protein